MSSKRPHEMVIRDYLKGDYKQVLELWKATGIYDPERDDSESAILRCNELGGKFLIMVGPGSGNRSGKGNVSGKGNGNVIGTSWMTHDGRRIHLHHFAILPELQGKGLGRILAEESLRFAEEKGCQVKLEVHRENLRALSLYEHFGFRHFKDYLILMNRHP